MFNTSDNIKVLEGGSINVPPPGRDMVECGGGFTKEDDVVTGRGS